MLCFKESILGIAVKSKKQSYGDQWDYEEFPELGKISVHIPLSIPVRRHFLRHLWVEIDVKAERKKDYPKAIASLFLIFLVWASQFNNISFTCLHS